MYIVINLLLSSFQITPPLRAVPSFVSGHTLCASRKAWFRRQARAIKCTTKMKGNFSNCDQISLMNLYLDQEHQNSSKSLSTNSLHLSAAKLAAICRKLYCKSNCKHVPADGTVRKQNKSGI